MAPGRVPQRYRGAGDRVADLSRVWIVASVPERPRSRVQVGQRVTIAIAAYPDQSFEGRIARVAGALDPETRSVHVIAELANAAAAQAGDVRARPLLGSRPSGRHGPGRRRRAGRAAHHVFVERATGEFERRDVSLGPRHSDAVVVMSGLASGDRVVVDGTMLLMGQ